MELEQVFKSYRDYKTKIEGKSKNSIDQYLYRIQSFLDYNNIKTKEDLTLRILLMAVFRRFWVWEKRS